MDGTVAAPVVGVAVAREATRAPPPRLAASPCRPPVRTTLLLALRNRMTTVGSSSSPEPISYRSAVSRLRRGGRVGSAVAAQGTAAAASLVLQIVVVRAIGEVGFGTYQVLLAALLLVTTIQTGLIGDSLNVLDRERPGVRGALMAAQGAALVAGTLVAVAVAVAVTIGTGGASLVAAYALATALWLLEDTCRRMFMARLRFWHLVVNDLVYLVVALGTLGALALRPEALALVDVLLATAAGAAAAVAAAVVQLPREDFRGGPITPGGLRELASFGGWRSAQAGVRPLATLATRTAVLAIAGAAALGQLQAARLLLAPVLTAMSGLGSFLLPTYRRQEPGGGWTSRRSLSRQTLLMTAAAVVYTVVVLLAADPLSQLLFSDAVAIDPVAVAGWGATAAATAAGLPVFTAAVVRREARKVFVIRSFDALLGVPLAVVVLLLVGPSWVPFAMTGGMVFAVWLLWRSTPGGRQRPPAPARPVPPA
jgi:O-antigen/teichoic acid export membrane protein